MATKIETQTSATIQKNLWTRVCRPNGVERRVRLVKAGHLPQSSSLAEANGLMENFGDMLGEFAPRVMVLPQTKEQLSAENVTVAGGWCALRSRDLDLMRDSSSIRDPLSSAEKVISSVEQYADWLRQSVAFDQIVESVGAVAAKEFVVISERRLWSSRIREKVALALRRKLNSAEEQKLCQALEDAELARSKLTEGYLREVVGGEFRFRRVVDEDIWGDLRAARDDTLYPIGWDVGRLSREFGISPKVINLSAMVWAMYSQPYFDVLRSNGYATGEFGLVVEPSEHACAETRPESVLAKELYAKKGVYLSPGLNNRTGFIPYFECLTGNGDNTRKALTIDEIPNVANWQTWMQSGGRLDPEKNATTNPAENQVFLWGMNLLPYGETLTALLSIGALADAFKAQKAEISKTIAVNRSDPEVFRANIASQQAKVNDLRIMIEQAVARQNEVVLANLNALFRKVTT